jgi:hypothetical protein
MHGATRIWRKRRKTREGSEESGIADAQDTTLSALHNPIWLFPIIFKLNVIIFIFHVSKLRFTEVKYREVMASQGFALWSIWSQSSQTPPLHQVGFRDRDDKPAGLTSESWLIQMWTTCTTTTLPSLPSARAWEHELGWLTPILPTSPWREPQHFSLFLTQLLRDHVSVLQSSWFLIMVKFRG